MRPEGHTSWHTSLEKSSPRTKKSDFGRFVPKTACVPEPNEEGHFTAEYVYDDAEDDQEDEVDAEDG